MADSLHTLVCPACGKEMKKIFVPDAGVNVDICVDGCGGIYFDNREFKKFDENAENIDEILEALEGKTFQEVDGSLLRHCPVCNAKMVKNFSSARGEVMIDECYACGGKFLDNNELQKIRAEFETEAERAEATMAELYKTVGVELRQLEEERKMADAKRTPLNRLFKSVIYGMKTNI
ncbi:zf-TFIIB domain-containing protein [bacterium]|nr:zf-TFIIB domain-containing protein [bacterium]